MPARNALKVVDDRPIQIFVAKPGENPAGRAIPVQRVLAGLKPLEARTRRGTTALVVKNRTQIQLCHAPAITERRVAPRTPRRAMLYDSALEEVTPAWAMNNNQLLPRIQFRKLI
jgi:hypothetical protein